ncbi:MAG: ABC transporter ATP-binding protein [Candidatus Thorarchaeota archaeon]|nr:ABC transporter ATP-binding protein [Candidatus Thorarchaeota archaeon]
MTKILELEKITKRYVMGEVPVDALRGISFGVEQGELVSILGPSGSGKSTLLNMIGALDRPTDGTLIIKGQNVSKFNDNELAETRKNVGFVFQFFNLIPRLNAVANVELPLTIAGVHGKERRALAEDALRMVGLGERMTHKSAELSGGERQRVAMARALVTKPSFLLMDEPTGNLDSKTAQDMMDLVVNLNEEQKMTVLIVTHDAEVAGRTRRTLRMRDGLIEEDVTN